VGNPYDVLVEPHQPTGRCAPGLAIDISVALKASFQRLERQCPGPGGAWTAWV